MREIKFRGKCVKSQKFIDGSLLIKDETPDKIMTYCGNKFEIIPETVGQYTGLKDKNSVEIYSGDTFIIKGIKYIVEWQEDSCRYVLTTGLGYDTKNCFDLTCDSIYNLEISGNIYE